jgi:acetyl-CoA acetyltransferase
LAIPDLLSKVGVKKEQVDIYEINEAFASQATYCVDKIGLDYKKVNPKGSRGFLKFRRSYCFGTPLGMHRSQANRHFVAGVKKN